MEPTEEHRIVYNPVLIKYFHHLEQKKSQTRDYVNLRQLQTS